MNINKRDMVLTLAGGGSVNLSVLVSTRTKLMTVDPAYLTPRVVLETPNLELTVPATVSIADLILPGRFVLVSRNDLPHNELGYMVYYDTKYKDMLVIPTLELYAGMTYLAGTTLEISGYSINFSGTEDDLHMPLPLAGTAVMSSLVSMAKHNNNARGGYYEKMVTPTLNFSSKSIYPSLFINFGLPSVLFGLTPFTAEANVLVYDSLSEFSAHSVGFRTITDDGFLVAELPL